jgi:hypothetical protein
MREIEKQIKKYLDLGVIRPIAASEYSNIHMVPKPTPGDWRFCLDFVQLNAATEGSDAWPIPNIKNMLSRIGSRKSKVFGVMDMTAGYHQAPISASAQVFTAFICFIGIFCWLRVPMGLKNAASYFQRVMATVVLAGILYVACELYIDDIFVFGKDEDEFVKHLGMVFDRLRQSKVTLNPKKCRFGMASVEYVGHVISADGITFSDEKRGKVLEFPLPRTQTELQAFLGLINYFRDHIPDMTSYEKPLRGLMDLSKKKMTLTWHADAEKAFYTARDIVAHCPALFFVNENAVIIVMTDASDYGVGAYIYQIIDGKEYPIIFFSRALHGAELNWATIEKEAFAIFLTLSKFGHLLRDNKFLLRTDHKNLPRTRRYARDLHQAFFFFDRPLDLTFTDVPQAIPVALTLSVLSVPLFPVCCPPLVPSRGCTIIYSSSPSKPKLSLSADSYRFLALSGSSAHRAPTFPTSLVRGGNATWESPVRGGPPQT